MIVSDELVARYFAPPRERLWRWSADGSALVTDKGKTIAFRQEAEAIVERLAPGGLPPFGAIVILLAACRDDWNAGLDVRSGIDRLILPTPQYDQGGTRLVIRKVNQLVMSRVQGILADLDKIAALKPELRKGVGAKALLAECVFESAERTARPPDSEAILRGLKRGIPNEMLQPVDYEDKNVFLRDLDTLRSTNTITNEILELRAKTGIGTDVAPAKVDEPLPERVRKLIEALRGDPDNDLAGLARLALDLMAAVHVPRALAQREELPLGGFTDIANRGHLDRLLVSELAHDDLILSIRVALNEALYLRRESPPRSPPRQRAILIDAGIRMWGLPRVFAAALALALAATAEKGAAVRCFRARSNGDDAPDAVDLSDRTGVIAHLAALETEPHPAASLQDFFEMLKTDAEPSDAILITHPDALDDAEFKATLAMIPDLSLYAASVDRSGCYRMLHIHARGQTLLAEAHLPLETILAPREKQASPKALPLRDEKIDPSLPVILSLTQFPFLLPHAIEPRRARLTEKGAMFAVTRDGRVTLRTSLNSGPLQLTDRVPYGAMRRILVSGESEALIVIDPQRKKELILFRVDKDGGTRTVKLQTRGDLPQEVLFINGQIVMIHNRRVDAFDPDSGVRVWRRPLTGMWVYGRYFYCREDSSQTHTWVALAAINGQLEFCRMPLTGCFFAIDRRVLPDANPWTLTASGLFAPLTGAQPIQFNLRGDDIIKFIAASDDGDRIIVKSRSGMYWALDAKSGSANVTKANWERWLEPRLVDYADVWPLRSRLKSIAIARDGLLFRDAHGKTHRIGLNSDARIVIERLDRWAPMYFERFVRTPQPPGARYELSAARLSDGSSIFLDSRGLLHLKSADASIPEMSLVLNDRHVTAWSPDGKQCGMDFFLADGSEMLSGAQFQARILQFTRRLL